MPIYIHEDLAHAGILGEPTITNFCFDAANSNHLWRVTVFTISA
jgi:hypothetical protein